MEIGGLPVNRAIGGAAAADGTTRFDVLEQRGRLHVLKRPSPWSLTAGPADRIEDALSSLRR